jgi:hypothetical protein
MFLLKIIVVFSILEFIAGCGGTCQYPSTWEAEVGVSHFKVSLGYIIVRPCFNCLKKTKQINNSSPKHIRIHLQPRICCLQELKKKKSRGLYLLVLACPRVVT